MTNSRRWKELLQWVEDCKASKEEITIEKLQNKIREIKKGESDVELEN